MVTFFKPNVKKIPFFLLFGLSFYPLMPEAIFSIFVFLFLGLTVIIHGRNFAPNWELYKIRPLIVNSGFYIIMVISVLYSSNPVFALEKLQSSILILIFPAIILMFMPKIKSIELKVYSIGFILANFILMCYFFNLLVEGMRIDRFPWLIEANLFEKIKVLWSLPYEFTISKAHKHLNVYYESHKTYLSLNFLVSILLATRLLKYKIHILLKGLILFISILFGIFIIYTQAITTILSLIIFVLFYPFFLFKYSRFKALYIIGLLIISFILYQTNVFNAFNNKNSKSIALLLNYFDTGELHEGIDTRAYIYDCSIILIEDKPFFGYGLGDVQNKLNDCYDKNDYVVARFNSVGEDINSHNYYFHLLLSGGVFCLLMFLFLLLNNSILAIRGKEYIYFFFLIIVAINLLTENLLVRINGVSVFVILNTLFYSSILGQRENGLSEISSNT